MANLTLLDLAKMNGSDAVVGLLEENLNAAPEVRVFPARTIRGTSYKTLIRKSFPTVSFRNANEGVATSKSEFDNKLVECFIIDSQIRVDKAVADAHEDGAATLQSIEASGVMQSTLQKVGSQIWYGTGTGGDTKGFPGAVQTVDASMVVDAGGTTAATGSSVYAVKVGDQYCKLVLGNQTTLELAEEWATQQVDDANGNAYTAYVNSLTGHVGCQFVHKFAVGRIKKITEDSGKKLTDLLIYDLFSKFPVGIKPDFLFMTRRSLRQLRDSRTATNETGAPAPVPTDVEGVPIIATDSLLNTEALTL